MGARDNIMVEENSARKKGLDHWVLSGSDWNSWVLQ